MQLKKTPPQTIEIRKSLIGDHIRDARKKQGISMSDLSRALGFAFPGFVCQIEHGTRPIPPEIISPMAKLLKLDKKDLCKRMATAYHSELVRISHGK